MLLLGGTTKNMAVAMLPDLFSLKQGYFKGSFYGYRILER